jgi:hypothetical protein
METVLVNIIYILSIALQIAVLGIMVIVGYAIFCIARLADAEAKSKNRK